MYNKYTYGLGTTRSCIRELFEYGLKQAAIVGKENVYDFSLGNPSIPSPKKVNESAKPFSSIYAWIFFCSSPLPKI